MSSGVLPLLSHSNPSICWLPRPEEWSRTAQLKVMPKRFGVAELQQVTEPELLAHQSEPHGTQVCGYTSRKMRHVPQLFQATKSTYLPLRSPNLHGNSGYCFYQPPQKTLSHSIIIMVFIISKINENWALLNVVYVLGVLTKNSNFAGCFPSFLQDLWWIRIFKFFN